MEANNDPSLSTEEVKKYVDDFLTTFFQLLIVAIAADMKKHAIVSVQDYLSILIFHFFLEKKRRGKIEQTKNPKAKIQNLWPL